MFIEERKERIMKYIDEYASVTVSQLCDLFNVSEVTIRKDLNDMGNEGLLIRTHGGAVKFRETAFEQNQASKENKQILEKQAIAAYVYENEIKDNETIILDAGTTTQELAKLIRRGERKNLTVITNALNVANELMGNEAYEVIFAGGLIRQNILSSVGMFSEELFNCIVADKAFVGTNSISAENGLTTPNMQECKIKQCMLNASRKRYVLVDSSKFKTNSLYCICKFKDLNMIVTDDGIGKSYISKINEKGGHVVTINVKK